MSFYPMTKNMYQLPPEGTPGWQFAPVPGWGMNPARAGKPWIAANGVGLMPYDPVPVMFDRAVGTSEGDAYRTQTDGTVALAAAGGIFLGWFLCWVYLNNKKK